MSTILLHLFWITLLAPALSWHLSGFAPLHAPVGQVAVWRNRAYICVPRYDLGTVTATLLEASWPETMNSSHKATQQAGGFSSHMSPRPYPRSDPTMQREGHCPSLQNVTALDVDSMRGRLWVLDAGTKICSPKVIVFDLRRNEEVLRVWLTNVASHALTSIVADPFVGAWGPRAYVGGSRSGALLVIGQSGWWQIGLDVKSLEKERMHAVGAVTLALSRRESLLYLAEPDSDRMFSLDLSAIRSSPQPSSNKAKRQPVTFLGRKLGPSRGLVQDLSAGLHYFLPRDHAVVRWDTRRPLSAESHTVLLQSPKTLPQVSHMFLDPQWQVWAVVGQRCVRIQKYSFV
ncbi:uncharacterized protein LOC110827463 [Zootermopsis nevadensis]|uniref:Bee-milk protein n=1 Tax=Zootermopsis nevadensis TaxID=136037 RepID=A0A067RWJ2_ZOONE|nr:uncharacterized protein LOC110827463 [Zootermopsis nevadensis]KDR24274.1 hypothetical protein L798_06734 [Zootermopsis nevadensis]